MSKRANGEGTIYFNEKKQIYQAMLTTPAGKRLTKASKDKSVVQDWLNEQRLLVGRNQHIEPHSISFKEWAEEWLEVYAKPNVRPRTYDRYISLTNHAEPLFDLKLTQVSPSHIQKMYNSLISLTGSTKRKIHYCLRIMLQQAVINQLIHSNPCNNIKPPRAEHKEIEIFTKEEADKILQEAKKRPHYLVVLLAHSTGMRLSEILGLRWEDIDIKKATLSISQTVHRSKSAGLYFPEPKNKNSKRKVPLPAETVQGIIEHKLQNGINSGLLFLTRDNLPLNGSVYAKTFRKIKKETGISKNFHAFRHTYASTLLAKGVPLTDIARLIGHARVSTTLDFYSHCLPDNDNNLAQKISDLLFKKS